MQQPTPDRLLEPELSRHRLEMLAGKPAGMTYLRLRVELADRPGVFAGATAALAALGVDLLAVDVLEENGPTVIDELVVSLPPGVAVQHVEDALRMAGAIELLSTSVDGPTRDPVVRVLDQVLTV